MTKATFKKLIEKTFNKAINKATCLSEREIKGETHYEWVVISKVTGVVEALFCATDTCVYTVKYVSGTELKSLDALNKKLRENR